MLVLRGVLGLELGWPRKHVEHSTFLALECRKCCWHQNVQWMVERIQGF